MTKHRLIVIGVAIFAVVVSAGFLAWPKKQKQLEVSGELSGHDLQTVTRIVQAAMQPRQADDRDRGERYWSLFSRQPSWTHLKMYWAIRRECSPDWIVRITVAKNGAIEVSTEVKAGGSGWYYDLSKGPRGWEITKRGRWKAQQARSRTTPVEASPWIRAPVARRA